VGFGVTADVALLAQIGSAHFDSIWASMMRLTSSAMEIPSRFDSRLRNVRCGSVKEIICFVICLDLLRQLLLIDCRCLSVHRYVESRLYDCGQKPTSRLDYVSATEGPTWFNPSCGISDYVYENGIIASKVVTAESSTVGLQNDCWNWKADREAVFDEPSRYAHQVSFQKNIIVWIEAHALSIPQGIQWEYAYAA